ncbi:hypothetical protein [Pedobacter boryungensis]|uniref:Lipocalin-like domain-containing protein n=1 Tax=Pedobacter boryungensis TaxID=869962 RepID=A0ABX2DC42_9SPHI|nr:hypothetical protein [Pedobacter boryungensis]NQX31515.1 hypothetical protein [Pedobacter boryungensis]
MIRRYMFFICLIFSCNSKEVNKDRAKVILGKWALTTNKSHGWEVTKESISYFNRKDRSSYQLFGDSIRTMSSYFNRVDVFALKFTGNDTLTVNGIDGEHIYVRVK